MTDLNILRVAELLLVMSLIGSLTLLILMLTVFFKAVRTIENRIASPGKQLDGIRQVWGNGPLGRWMRIMHVYRFFIFRRLPVWGKSIEQRMGEENPGLPASLRLMLMVPMTLYIFLTVTFFVSGWYVKYGAAG